MDAKQTILGYGYCFSGGYSDPENIDNRVGDFWMAAPLMSEPPEIIYTQNCYKARGVREDGKTIQGWLHLENWLAIDKNQEDDIGKFPCGIGEAFTKSNIPKLSSEHIAKIMSEALGVSYLGMLELADWTDIEEPDSGFRFADLVETD